MPELRRAVDILEQALVQEMFERGQLGDYPDGLTGARFDPEDFDYRLQKAFSIRWIGDTFEIVPLPKEIAPGLGPMPSKEALGG